MIGILGATGAVGRQVARLLAAEQHHPLRLGGRDGASVRRCADELGIAAQAISVDITDEAALADFVRGCRLVVTCAGPSHRMAGPIASAAIDAGADIVDAGGNSAIAAMDTGDRTAVFFAGALPGLSGILPRWLARDFDSVRDLLAYSGALDHFSAAGAEDYLDGVFGAGTEPLAAWRDGRPVDNVLTRARIDLPGFGSDAMALPYLDDESRRLATDLSLRDGQWYSVVDGRHLGAALDQARALSSADAVTRLRRAAALDLAGREPHVTFLVQARGLRAGRALTRTAVLRAAGIADLTATATGLAALAVIGGGIAPGAHHAATVLDPPYIVDTLLTASALHELSVHDSSIAELAMVEEGAL
ncbi:saccharopine dehydrogenase NADP-binding domain-containing protein [Nocardia sp. NPDC058658]|uniref:saccharopine dehydrogenase NADP-binding domain-containing protein n=1 Tax=Nocardia sp. NPDC058658 TaxID=3346580 RepID=UPI0036646C9F